MSEMKIKKSTVVAAFEEMGNIDAAKWSASRLQAKVMKLPEHADELSEIESDSARATVTALLEAIRDDKEIVIVDDASKQARGIEDPKPTAAKKKSKAKKAPPPDEDEEDEEDSEVEDDEDDSEEEETPPKKAKGKKPEKKSKASEKPAKAKKVAEPEEDDDDDDEDEEDEKPAKKKKAAPKSTMTREESRKWAAAAYEVYKKWKDKSYSSDNINALEKATKGNISRKTLNFWIWNWNNGRRIPGKKAKPAEKPAKTAAKKVEKKAEKKKVVKPGKKK